MKRERNGKKLKELEPATQEWNRGSCMKEKCQRNHPFTRLKRRLRHDVEAVFLFEDEIDIIPLADLLESPGVIGLSHGCLKESGISLASFTGCQGQSDWIRLFNRNLLMNPVDEQRGTEIILYRETLIRSGTEHKDLFEGMFYDVVDNALEVDQRSGDDVF